MFGKRKKQRLKEEKKRKKKEKIRKKALKEINSLSRKIKSKELDAQAKEFYELVRKFFAKLFKIKYQYTYDELRKEVEKKKIDKKYKERIENLTKRLTYLEYSNITITNEKLKDLIKEFKFLVKKLTLVKKPEEKKVSKKLDLLLKKISEKADIFNRLKIKKIAKPKKVINEINLLLKEGKEALKQKNKQKAQNIYLKIDKLYRKLSSKDKNRIYKKIALVYPKKEPIYDLLNEAYISLVNNDINTAKRVYHNIRREYMDLPEQEKEKMHDEILKVFKPKHKENIEVLIKKSYYFLAKKNIEGLKQVYNEIEKAYRDLPVNEKEKYYSEIIKLYDDIKLILT